jgi:hypothetical protein
MNNRRAQRSPIDTIQAHGFTTAHLLQRDDWQQTARKASATRHALRSSGHPPRVRRVVIRFPAPVLASWLGRFGTRLRGSGRTTVTPAR